MREGDAEEKEEEEVPPPIISLPDLVAAMDLAWHGGREVRGSEAMPWTWPAVGEAWWTGVATVAMNVGRTMPKWCSPSSGSPCQV